MEDDDIEPTGGSPTPKRSPGPLPDAAEAATILVVDDDPDVLAALSDALAEEGYHVRGAHDGAEALDVIAEQRPDLIITDLLMPTMTGFELLGALHDNPELSTIPTLIITAARTGESEPAPSPGVFPKPLNLERLLRAIRAYTHTDDDAGRRN